MWPALLFHAGDNQAMTPHPILSPPPAADHSKGDCNKNAYIFSWCFASSPVRMVYCCEIWEPRTGITNARELTTALLQNAFRRRRVRTTGDDTTPLRLPFAVFQTPKAIVCVPSHWLLRLPEGYKKHTWGHKSIGNGNTFSPTGRQMNCINVAQGTALKIILLAPPSQPRRLSCSWKLHREVRPPLQALLVHSGPTQAPRNAQILCVRW